MNSNSFRLTLLLLLWVGFLPLAQAQLDPEKRQLIQLGYNQPLEGQGPIAGYAFYYLNEPNFHSSNVTLRLAVAPVYLDSEFGFKDALGPHTDLGLGLSGGGFADSFSEVVGGNYLKKQSFTGHGGELSTSLYHLFNPSQQIPLYAVLKGGVHYSKYQRDSETDTNPTNFFELPDDRVTYLMRVGLRWGGMEPLMRPPLAMELSVWYEGQFRTDSGTYGYFDDRKVQAHSHLFWGRALLAYTMPEWKHYFSLGLTAGTSVDADRFSAYRLGSVLPLASEFPLNLPGYYFQEITARKFVHFNGLYSIPLDKAGRWSVNAFESTALVDYLPGMAQPGHWHSGVGGGVAYQSPHNTLQIVAGYAYGIDAIRNGGRGAQSIGLLCQFDLEARLHQGLPHIFESPYKSRGLFRFFEGF
ncbi:MAG: hypothetical protein HY298_13440 [Verrucomicrobia bacterium]|nr:hypothetical protein [Verrucomicrobiota bacterium]